MSLKSANITNYREPDGTERYVLSYTYWSGDFGTRKFDTFHEATTGLQLLEELASEPVDTTEQPQEIIDGQDDEQRSDEHTETTE